MNIVEPQRGHTLLQTLNTAVFNSPTLTDIVPILADIFVFGYPIILVIRYGRGLIKKNTQLKSDSLRVLCSVGYVFIANMILQALLHKDRPIFSEGSSIHLILKELPTAAFPSDHAAVSMIVALMIVSIGYKRNITLLKVLGYILLGCAIIMSVSRVAVGVHRPTDIIAGWIVALIILGLTNISTLQNIQQIYIINPLIKLQEWIFNLFGLR